MRIETWLPLAAVLLATGGCNLTLNGDVDGEAALNLDSPVSRAEAPSKPGRELPRGATGGPGSGNHGGQGGADQGPGPGPGNTGVARPAPDLFPTDLNLQLPEHLKGSNGRRAR
mgnify:CR=1 FL=1